jgi:hypothetical protein
MTDTAQTFKLLDASGNIIMQGALSTMLECLPDTQARSDAVEAMYRIACDAVEAEERVAEARACAIKHFCDGISRLAERLDQFEKARSQSMKRAQAEQQKRDRARVQKYVDTEWDDPDEPDALYSIDPTERQAEMGDQDPEGIPPPADPAGAVLKDAGLEGEVTTTERTPDPEDLGHARDPKQVTPPVAASFW